MIPDSTLHHLLYGWSVVLDIFHGMAHDIAVSTRGAVTVMGPLLLCMSGQMGDTQGAGMELIC